MSTLLTPELLIPAPRAALDTEVVELRLSQGKLTTIDRADLELVESYGRWRQFKSSSGCTYYAMAAIRKPDGRQTSLLLHRLLTGAPKGVRVDHRDGNGLNNRRSNLRLATGTQNCSNRAHAQNNTSGFKGVSSAKRGGKWKAYVSVNHNKIHLGYYTDRWAAAVAYNVAALGHFGDYAAINAPDGSSVRVGEGLGNWTLEQLTTP